MKTKVSLLFLGLFVFACAAFDYRWYGMDTSATNPKLLEDIKLFPGRQEDKKQTGRLCFHLKEQTPRCVVMRAEDFRTLMSRYAEMEQRLKDCEQ